MFLPRYKKDKKKKTEETTPNTEEVTPDNQ